MAKRLWILALVVLVPATIICFLASASLAFHAASGLPPEHPEKQAASQRSDTFFVLFLLSAASTTVAAVMLHRVLRSENSRAFPTGK
jgi:hypothetical protein